MINTVTTPTVVLRDINTITPYEKNAKRHTLEQIQKLSESILQNGWTQPIVLDGNGVIIAGHGRFLAAQRLKLKLIPSIIMDNLNETQIKALRLSDNKLVSDDYDQSNIKSEVLDIQRDTNIDLRLLGFSQKELEVFLDDIVVPNINELVEAPSEQQKAIYRPRAKKEPMMRRQDFLGNLRMTPEIANTLKDFQLKISVMMDEPWPAAFVTYARKLVNNEL